MAAIAHKTSELDVDRTNAFKAPALHRTCRYRRCFATEIFTGGGFVIENVIEEHDLLLSVAAELRRQEED